MTAFDDDDLANLLSDDEIIHESNDLNFVGYDNDDDDKESSNDENNDDPFSIDNLSSDDQDQNESKNDMDIDDNVEIEGETTKHDADNGMEEEEDEEEDDIDWDELHPWPERSNHGAFVSRVISIEKVPVSMTKKVLIQTLFHDIPSVFHPIDIRLFHNRHYLSQKDNSKFGNGQLIFNDKKIVQQIMPLLKQKQAMINKKFRLFRKSKLKDIITDHSLHRNLKDNTLRLVFINLNWKCKALNIYQFIKKCLITSKQTNQEFNDVNINKMLPIKIQIIEDDRGYVTGCAFVDFDDMLTATKVLFACHGKQLLDKPVYIDWHPFPTRVKTWIKQQKVFKRTKNTQTLLINNLHHDITENDIQLFIEKHLTKIKNNDHGVTIKDIQIVHNREKSLLCGYCLVSFINKNNDNYKENVFEVMQQLLNRIQYKVLQHRSIFVMFTKTPSQYYYNLENHQSKNKSKNIDLKDKTRFVILDNLVWNIQEHALRDFIRNECCAKPEKLDKDALIYHSINIIVDSNGYALNKALIKCLSPEIATQMVNDLDGKLCSDRMVIVDWCDENKYRSFQSSHNALHLNMMEFSSQYNSTQMTYLHDQLYGGSDFGGKAELKNRKRSIKNKMDRYDNDNNNDYNERKRMNKNSDIMWKYNNAVWNKRKERKRIFQKAKISMIDERMLREIKQGKMIQDVRPKTFGEIKAKERRGKTGIWTSLGMSKGEMLNLKKKVDWSTGKSILSKVIAKKKTIHVKDYWGDSLKHARKRNRNKWYIQKTNKNSQYRRKKSKKGRK